MQAHQSSCHTRGIFREARGSTSDLLLLSEAGEHLPKMARLGVYDPKILCANCKARFSAIDTYGAQALTVAALNPKFTPTSSGGAIIGYESASLDPLRVLRFLIAVLWRATVSRQPFYGAVNLGPLEPIALRFALEGGADSSVFDAVLSRWESGAGDAEPKIIIMDPRPERWAGGVRGGDNRRGARDSGTSHSLRPLTKVSLVLYRCSSLACSGASAMKGGGSRFPLRFASGERV